MLMVLDSIPDGCVVIVVSVVHGSPLVLQVFVANK